jgi:hypothetical protein
VRTADVHSILEGEMVPDEFAVGERAVRGRAERSRDDGLVESWIDATGGVSRLAQIETAFEPRWVHDTRDRYATELTDLGPKSEE